jgi:hypothetical protein
MSHKRQSLSRNTESRMKIRETCKNFVTRLAGGIKGNCRKWALHSLPGVVFFPVTLTLRKLCYTRDLTLPGIPVARSGQKCHCKPCTCRRIRGHSDSWPADIIGTMMRAHDEEIMTARCASPGSETVASRQLAWPQHDEHTVATVVSMRSSEAMLRDDESDLHYSRNEQNPVNASGTPRSWQPMDVESSYTSTALTTPLPDHDGPRTSTTTPWIDGVVALADTCHQLWKQQTKACHVCSAYVEKQVEFERREESYWPSTAAAHPQVQFYRSFLFDEESVMETVRSRWIDEDDGDRDDEVLDPAVVEQLAGLDQQQQQQQPSHSSWLPQGTFA